MIEGLPLVGIRAHCAVVVMLQCELWTGGGGDADGEPKIGLERGRRGGE